MKAIIQRYGHDVLSGIEAIFTNKVKSFLTALGIIFGVAAVISMLAIGNGAQQEILEQIKMVGVNNIIVTPTDFAVENESDQSSEAGLQISTKKFSKGLTIQDAEAIRDVIPSVDRVSPVISFNYSAILNGKSKPVVLEGVQNTYFQLFNINVSEGSYFTDEQMEEGFPVCIIGDNIKNVFFNKENPIGNKIKCGQIWLKVVGVVERRDFTASASDEMGISSTDNKIFVPARSMILRFKDRSLVRADEVEALMAQGDEKNPKENVNQLDKIIVQVKETETLNSTADIVTRMLLRRHNELYDFEVTIPELLLKQQQRTKGIFNIVLGVIAGISLIVGGIGIMNIMLASVMERIREIGVRQAIGASRKDIIVQFLSESTIISVTGGIMGIILGVVLSKTITAIFDIQTIVSAFSIFISFGVSVLVGIVFGYVPAKRAAEQDPVNSLRS